MSRSRRKQKRPRACNCWYCWTGDAKKRECIAVLRSREMNEARRVLVEGR